MEERLIHDHEFGRMLGVSRKTVWSWVKLKLIPGPWVQRPNFTRWRLSDCEKAILDLRTNELQEAAR